MEDFATFVQPREASFDGERVAEVGIGDGALGAWLLANGASHWTGIDISHRSIMDARSLLQARGHDEHEDFELEESSSANLAMHTPDVILSFKTMQHFPSMRYTRHFLQSAASSGARRLIFQWVGSCDTNTAMLDERCDDYDKDFQGARCKVSVGSVMAAVGTEFTLTWAETGKLGYEDSVCNLWAGFSLRQHKE